jgi:hypothetical protein
MKVVVHAQVIDDEGRIGPPEREAVGSDVQTPLTIVGSWIAKQIVMGGHDAFDLTVEVKRQ